MADKRELLFSFIGKETISPAAKKASAAVEDLGTGLKKTGSQAERLDAQIEDTEKQIKSLAEEIQRTGDLDLFKKLNASKRDLKKLITVKDLLPSEDETKRESVNIGKKLAGGVANGLLSAGAGISNVLGKVVGTLPPQAQAAIGAGVIAAVTASSAVAGAVLASALATAVAGGVVAGGVALAFQDPEIKAAAKSLGADLKADLVDAASSFKAPVKEALSSLRGDFKAMLPDIKSTFASASQYVRPLTAGLSGFLREMLPGIKSLTAAAKPVIDVLSTGLKDIGHDIGRVFDDLSDNGAEMAGGMKIAIFGIRLAISSVGFAVNVLTEAFGGLMGMVFKLSDWFQKIGTALAPLPGIAGEVGRGILNINGPIQDGKAKWNEWKGAATGGLFGAKDATGEMTDAQVILNGSMQEAIGIAGSLSAAFNMLNGASMTSREANREYEAAIDAVTASVKENGHAWNDTTEKGRANKQVIDDLIGSIDRKAQALYDEKAATGDVAGAEAIYQQTMANGKEQLIASLTQILGNEKAARKLAESLFKIPAAKNTVVTANTKSAMDSVAAIIKRINNMHARINVHAEPSGGYGGSAHTGDGYSTGMASGGPITGRGPKGVDSVPMMLAPGEYVLNDKDVDRLGGFSGVERLRAGLRSSATPSRGSAPAATASNHAEPRPVNHNIFLDGKLIYAYTDQQISNADHWRKVGKR